MNRAVNALDGLVLIWVRDRVLETTSTKLPVRRCLAHSQIDTGPTFEYAASTAMPGAIRTTIDASIVNAMRATRMRADLQAEEKLRLLRRLRRRYETKSLPKETSAETSFIEQIFAKLFDYMTLLSHDNDHHHLYAKPYVSGSGRFPDFSLEKYRPNGEMFIASAELKGPDADLDAAQGGNYGGLSPVQQAFKAVKGKQSCRWIIVSNLVELRLYRREDLASDTSKPPDPIAVAFLNNVWDRKDLARLCAHFDYDALIGKSLNEDEEPRSELMAALERKHPATPLDPKADHVRLILLFTPRAAQDLPLFMIERRLRAGIKSTDTAAFLGAAGANAFDLADGCITMLGNELQDGTQCKIALTGEGQLQMSIRRKVETGKVIPAEWLVNAIHFFAELLEKVFDGLTETTIPGRISPEFRDVTGVKLKVANSLEESGAPTEGDAKNDILGVDFMHSPVLNDRATIAADVASELAIYFRSTAGGVALNRDKVRNWKVRSP